MQIYNPDTQPFELALSNIPIGNDQEREALVNVADTIDFAKRMLLQHKVKNFTAADVVAVSQMIIAERDKIANRGKE